MRGGLALDRAARYINADFRTSGADAARNNASGAR